MTPCPVLTPSTDNATSIIKIIELFQNCSLQQKRRILITKWWLIILWSVEQYWYPNLGLRDSSCNQKTDDGDWLKSFFGLLIYWRNMRCFFESGQSSHFQPKIFCLWFRQRLPLLPSPWTAEPTDTTSPKGAFHRNLRNLFYSNRTILFL